MTRSTLSTSLLAVLLLTACPASDTGLPPPPDAGPGDAGQDAGPSNPCGNGMIDGTEACDGSNLNGATCAGLGVGYVGGTLACNADCTLDDSGCVSPMCGDGFIDPGEQCDGREHGGETCGSLGFIGGGVLRCNSDCTFDTSQCSSCGDGMIQAPEECDGSDLGGADCVSRGHTGGTLVCDTLCHFDESGCTG